MGASRRHITLTVAAEFIPQMARGHTRAVRRLPMKEVPFYNQAIQISAILQANRDLRQRVKELEARLAVYEAPVAVKNVSTPQLHHPGNKKKQHCAVKFATKSPQLFRSPERLEKFKGAAVPTPRNLIKRLNETQKQLACSPVKLSPFKSLWPAPATS